MQTPTRRYREAGYLLSGLLCLVVTLLLLVPVPKSPVPFVTGLDKLVHFGLFFLMVLPSLTVSPRSWVWVVPLAIAFGGFIELLQPYFGRGMELADFVADALGVLCAVPVGRWLHARWLETGKLRDHERP